MYQRARGNLQRLYALAKSGKKLVLIFGLCICAAYVHLVYPENFVLSNNTEKGHEFFKTRWVVPFISNGRWGRGPHSNAETCDSCHTQSTPEKARNKLRDTRILKLGIRDLELERKTRPDARYGNELSRFGVIGQLLPEGDFSLTWITETIREVALQRPVPNITDLNFGDFEKDTVFSVRQGNPLEGIGVLSEIPAEIIIEFEKEQPKLRLDGRINWVAGNKSDKLEIGRFGYKASAPTLFSQVSLAFHDELGVTSKDHPDDPCAGADSVCLELAKISSAEINDERLNDVTAYLKNLTVESNRTQFSQDGYDVFQSIRCSDCHRTKVLVTSETDTTQEPKYINPLTDLLIHDMGEGLSDDLPEWNARGRDWRTSPLWGIGSKIDSGKYLLHDGRAKTIEEAIAWHGGEALPSAEAYFSLTCKEKDSLLVFLKSL
ncbi:MAG: di-heme oxidoredictase family protein [Betaproteobacteria bacterium]